MRALCLTALLGFATAGAAIADENPAAGEAAAPRALKPAVAYSGAPVADVAGGVRTGATYTGNLNVQLDIDGAAWLGWADTLAYLDGLWVQGGLPGNFVGDAQGVSSTSAPNTVKLYEAWVQKNFRGNQVSALAGLFDLNSEFYRLQSAGLFLNSSFGIGPEFSQSGVNGPSIFPNTSVGLRIALKPTEGVVIRGALLDGAPVDRPDGSRGVFKSGDGALVVAEVALLNRPSPEARPSSRRFRLGRRAMLGGYDDKVALGGWYYTASFDDLSETQSDGQPVRHRGSGGLYALTDRLLYTNPRRPDEKLTGFVQAGIGDSRVNRFGSYLGMGLTAVGVFEGRSTDELGLALAYARNGSHFMSEQRMQALPVTTAEKTIELTYLIQANKWLALQPDLQYVITPNTTPTTANALAFQLRFEINF